MRVTIAAVAERAGVSKATVSRVLNDYPVRDTTRKRVMAAMRELDYRPNALARNLPLKKSQTIAVVTPGFSDAFYSEIVEGIEQVLVERDYMMTLCTTRHNTDRERLYTRLLQERRVDGILLLTPRETDVLPVVDWFPQSKSLIVLVDAPASRNGSSAIRVDNYGGGEMITKHLISLGHRRIAVISGPKSAPESKERLMGYKAALEESGIPFDPNMVFPGDYQATSGAAAVRRILALNPRPTAVFAMNDAMAIAAMEVMEQHGLSIPGDVAVVGFDDIKPASWIRPRLTTIRQPLVEMGRVATKKLLNVINGDETETVTISLPVELIVRESCGA